MMIIDAHTHVPTASYADRYGGSGADFLDACDANGVHGAWVFPTEGLSDQDPTFNADVVDYCSDDPSRLIPFCTAYPQLEGAANVVREAVEEGARGIKLHPWLQGFSVTEPYMADIGAVATELSLPIVFHDGTPPSSSPTQIGEFADAFPRVAVILGHGGLHDLWMEAASVAATRSNVYVIPSGVPSGAVAAVVRGVGYQKVLFGSDLGYNERDVQKYQLEKIHRLSLPEAQIAAILGGNAQRILS
jgi:predicted TIM-barrel fold metal-dependent hydrolase